VGADGRSAVLHTESAGGLSTARFGDRNAPRHAHHLQRSGSATAFRMCGAVDEHTCPLLGRDPLIRFVKRHSPTSERCEAVRVDFGWLHFSGRLTNHQSPGAALGCAPNIVRVRGDMQRVTCANRAAAAQGDWRA
jgi:hypothetical protein